MAAPAPPAAAGGLPQFDLAQWPGQIVWVLIVFVVLYVLFAKVFLPRVGGTIDAREDRIGGEIGDARRMRDEAAAEAAAAQGEMAQARAQARKLAEDAGKEANAAAAQSRAAEDARIAAVLAAADQRIAGARDAAMGQICGVAADAAAAMVGRLTGRTPTAAEVASALTAPTR